MSGHRHVHVPAAPQRAVFVQHFSAAELHDASALRLVGAAQMQCRVSACGCECETRFHDGVGMVQRLVFVLKACVNAGTSPEWHWLLS